MFKKYFILFGLLLILNIPLHSQIFFPILPVDSTINVKNDPVGRPYGGGSGYFPIIQPGESNIVINTNDFNNLKSELANAGYGNIIFQILISVILARLISKDEWGFLILATSSITIIIIIFHRINRIKQIQISIYHRYR